MIAPFPILGQTNGVYALDLKDSTSYNVTCGSINPAQWSVKNDSCILSTPALYSASPIKYVPYAIKINQSGNLTADNNAYIQIQVNGGAWVTKAAIIGLGLTNVFTYNDSVLLGSGMTIKIRVIMENNKMNEFWAIKNGEITISNVTCCTALPVTFLDFNLWVNYTSVFVNWKTASETNNDYFTVERSSNMKNFEELSRLKGAGNSNRVIEYNTVDDNPIKGASFYRIKQIDFDGKTSYSKTISINFKKNNSFKVSPIPIISGSFLKVALDENINEECLVVVYSSKGEIVFNQKKMFEKGIIEIAVPFERGVYSINIYTKTNKFSNTLLIL